MSFDYEIPLMDLFQQYVEWRHEGEKKKEVPKEIDKRISETIDELHYLFEEANKYS